MNRPEQASPESKRPRSVIWNTTIIVGVGFALCCGVPAGLIDRYVLFHKYGYEQTSSANIGNVTVDLSVNPGKRSEGPPDSLFGPPYAISVMLRDTTRSAVEAQLHSFHVRLADGQMIAGKTSVDHAKWKEGLDLTMLYVNYKLDVLGSQPAAIADIEIVYPDHSVRETVEIQLRATHTAATSIFPS